MIDYTKDELIIALKKKLLDLKTQQFIHSKSPEGPMKDRVSSRIDNEILKVKKTLNNRLLEIAKINGEEKKNRTL